MKHIYEPVSRMLIKKSIDQIRLSALGLYRNAVYRHYIEISK